MRVRLWDWHDAIGYMEDRVREHQAAESLSDDALPVCSPEERWEKPTTYAVMKKGRKSAVRVLDNEVDAEQMAADKGAGHYVEVRHGESARCVDYCPVNTYCNQYQGDIDG